MNKVIFTAIVGSYDEVTQPKCISEEFDYVLFSNDFSDKRIGVWQVRKIPYHNDDPTRVARWVKTHPHILFPDYRYSVWTDGNVRIAQDDTYKLFEDLYDKGVLVSSFSHSRKNCAYKECIGIMLSGKDSLENMLPEVYKMKDDGYPSNNGLCETNCVYMKIDDPKVSDVCETWWRMIDKYSKRDQLSFNYSLWINHLPVNYLLGKQHCARNHAFFDYVSHAGANKGIGFFMRFLRFGIYQLCLPVLRVILKANKHSKIEHASVAILYQIEKLWRTII